jgi:hypothetical protein
MPFECVPLFPKSHCQQDVCHINIISATFTWNATDKMCLLQWTLSGLVLMSDMLKAFFHSEDCLHVVTILQTFKLLSKALHVKYKNCMVTLLFTVQTTSHAIVKSQIDQLQYLS